MDYFIYSLFFLAGGLISHILFSRGPGPFEKTLWHGLYQGKRVVVCVDDDAYIFEMVGNRLRITQGTSEFTETRDGNDMAGGGNHQSGDTGTPGI